MDFEEEPMDLDLSSSSMRHVDAMDIAYNESNLSLDIKIKEEPIDTDNEDVKEVIENKTTVNETPVNDTTANYTTIRSPTVIKRYSLQRKEHKSWSATTLSVIFTIATLLTVLLYNIMRFECSKELDLKLLKESLNKHVIGQHQAIENIIESLEETNSNKILLLYGGTGVGKTLTVSLILENLHQYSNIYHYTMPSFSDTFSTDLMLSLTFCPTSMIIVDDLHGTDMHVIEQVQKVIEKSENLNKKITMILVFNCDTTNNQYVKKCDYSFSKDLQEAFKEIKALKRLIKFHSLSEEHLRKCIEKELGDKILTDTQFENIIKNFNVSIDGCKGVYTKIKMLNLN